MKADEQAVLNMLLAGHTVAQAAERLDVPYEAARYAERRARARVGARNRVQLMAAHGVQGRTPHAHRVPDEVQREIVARRTGPGRERVKTLAKEFGLNESTIFRIIVRSRVREANEEAERMLKEGV